MALATATTWQAFTGQTLAGADLTALESIATAVDAAIKKRLRHPVELTTYTNLIFDAPATEVFSLAKYAPVRASGLTIYRNPTAYGQASAFNSTHLLTVGVDYFLDLGPDNATESRSGLVYRVGGAWWGVSYRYPHLSLDSRVGSAKGSLLVSFSAGYSAVPADITLAAHLAMSKIREMRLYGGQASSQSWNGGSFSLSGQGSAVDVLNDPTISALLRPYGGNQVIIG